MTEASIPRRLGEPWPGFSLAWVFLEATDILLGSARADSTGAMTRMSVFVCAQTETRIRFNECSVSLLVRRFDLWPRAEPGLRRRNGGYPQGE